MEKQKYAKLFKILLWVLMILSVGVLIWGWLAGFEANDGKMTNVLLYWAYIMVGIALFAVICVGLYVSATTNPKSLIKLGLIAVGVIVLVGIAYVLASGAPAVGLTSAKLPTDSELKMTDTVLNLAYILGGAAILAIIFGEVMSVIRKK